MVELLAPAKSKACAKTAINYGADAIYIGASEFGARKNVANSLLDIEEVIQYAHKFNVKVYITINTILTDDELSRARKLISRLVKIGADAIIIQDMGLVENWNGSIPYHASTQCDNRTSEKVKFLESIGFSRVILARELSIEQIKKIKSQTNVELEAFIHGALCVSYSGQCYLSQMIGGRSANRGECAQPCRKKYSLVDENGDFIAKDKYLLSLKDFNASNHLKILAKAGISSFKIEGRLKDENYIKNVVGYYRKLIDELGLGKTSSGKIIFDFEPNLKKSFNRGFTDYFLEQTEAEWRNYPLERRTSLQESGIENEIYSFDSPKSKGECLGKVSKIGQNYFEIAKPPSKNKKKVMVEKNIHAQDGLCFYVKNKLSGCLVNKVDEVEAFRSGRFGKLQKIFPYKMDGIIVGTEIYRNFDSEFEKILKNSKTCRKISADICFYLGKIKIIDEDKNSVEITYEFDEFAKNETKMVENIKNQLRKAGESDFLINIIEIVTDKIPFLPISRLNELRRELLEKLMNERHKSAKIQKNMDIPKGPFVHDILTIDYRANILNESAKTFYETHGYKVTEMALETGKVIKAGKVAMTTKHCLKYAFNLCKSPKKLILVDEKNKRYELQFDCNNCEMKIIY